jgi:GAF domain-containing protein
VADHEDSGDRLEAGVNDLGGVLLSERSIDELLDLVVSTARISLQGTDGVSISLSRDGTLLTSHATDDVVRELDHVQYQHEAGPCVEAISTNRPVSITVSDEEERYRAFVRRAEQRFMTAVLSVPLTVGGDNLGALNFYSASLPRFGHSESEAAHLFAREASILMANAVAYAQSNATVEQLQAALRTRDIIGQAKGVLIARTGCSADEAFDHLRERSQSSNKKLRDVAAELVADEQGRVR